MTDQPIRVAMWSGPRNISTAMMRSWENRPDTVVIDEPLYGHYLKQTGLDHPGRDDVIAAQPSDDWRDVTNALTGPIPSGARIYYQKHMAHHLLPSMDTDWLDQLVNCFLIREPREMITSLMQVTPNPRVEDTGLPQQERMLRDLEERTGTRPMILDARDVLTHPRRMLTLLCDQLGIEFLDDMLSWPAGARESDGVWASHWYASVEKSTGFAPWKPKDIPVPDHLRDVHAECDAIYRRLSDLRLTPTS